MNTQNHTGIYPVSAFTIKDDPDLKTEDFNSGADWRETHSLIRDISDSDCFAEYVHDFFEEYESVFVD